MTKPGEGAATVRRWFSRITEKLGGLIASHREHREAWKGVTEPGPDGLSPFQQATEEVVRSALDARGLELMDRQVVRMEAGDERYIVAEIPSLETRIWMHRDQTDISAPTGELRLERWDARTPAEHHARVAAFLSELRVSDDGG